MSAEAAPLVPGWCALGTFVAAGFLFAITEWHARSGGIDRARLEGSWAGYDAADIRAAMDQWGEAGVRRYRDRLIPLDMMFAALVMLGAMLLAAWAASSSGSPVLGMLAGGPLVAAGLMDIREGLALRRVFANGAGPRPSLVALAAARTRIKRSLYAAGSVTAALAAFGLTIGWFWGSLLVAAAIAAKTIRWLRS